MVINNPVDNQPVSEQSEGIISRLRIIRKNSRNAARSGNPAKRAEALAANEKCVGKIREQYIRDAEQRAKAN